MNTASTGKDPKTRSNMLIGEHVHTLMWRTGRTQAQLAKLLGVDQGSVSRRLHGRREWSATEIAVTAAWLGVPPEQLLPEVELLHDDGDGDDDDDGGSGAPTRTRTWDLRIKSP